MNAIPLPALRPSHPLGFLASLGAHRTLARVAGIEVRLSWSGEATPHAILHADAEYEDLRDQLAAVWRRQADRGALFTLEIDGRTVRFPPGEPLADRDARKGKRGMNDPVKMLAVEYEQLARAAVAAEDAEAVDWLRAVATDVVLDQTNEPWIAALTHLYLLSRNQRLAQQFEETWEHVEHEPAADAIEAALRGWRRRAMKGGMNWDIDANRNAAESPTGTASTAVVPGAVWLAIMALPYFPVTGTRGRVATRGVSILAEGRTRRPMLVMPAWRPPLDVPAVETLLDHPLLGLDAEGRLRGKAAQLRGLGVVMVHGSTVVGRRVANQTEYYLGAAEALVPSS